MAINPSTLFLFAGEPSGDLHGSHLMHGLKQKFPACPFWGVGGPKMRQEGLKAVLKMEDFEVMGITDVFYSLPRFIKQFYFIRHEILTRNPSVAILIDYPGFNLRLAKALRKGGYKGKIVHYICPSVWAHSPQRIQQMADTLDLLLTVLPFEPRYFSGTSLPVAYVGNPLQEYIKKHAYQEDWKQVCGIPPYARILSLFPGSRKSEVERHAPVLREAAALFKLQYPGLCIALSCAHPEADKWVSGMDREIIRVPSRYTYELMRGSHCAIAKSGTVTLELALHKCPTIVFYKLTLLNKWYAQYILRLKLPYYALPNILAEGPVFPELIAEGFSAENIFLKIRPFLDNKGEREECLQGCGKIQALLKEDLASQKAAEHIGKLISC